MKRAVVAVVLLAAALSGGVGRSEAVFVATSTNAAGSFSTAADFNTVAVSLADPGTPLRGTVALAATASSERAMVSVRFQSAPAGSGTWTDRCTDTVAPYACDWDTTGLPNGLYDLRAIALDVGGYSQTSTVTSRRVDNTAPVVSLADDGTAKRGSITVQATTDDGDGAGISSIRYEYRSSGSGTWAEACTTPTAPFACNLDTTVAPDGLYDLRAIATDGAGFTATSNTITTRIDNTAPATATIASPGTPLSGTVTLSGTATDAGSGIASLRFQYAPTGTANWADACSAGSAPYSCAWNTAAVGDGVYDLRALATDKAGNTLASATVASRRVDNLVPSVTLDDPGSPLRGTRTISATASDGGGIASVAIAHKPTSGSAWTTICTDTTSPYSCSWSTTGVADGSYDLRATVTDNAGRTNTSILTARVVDNTAPRASAVTAASGGTLGTLSDDDALTLTYTEAIAPGSLVSGWTGTSRTVSLVFSRSGTTNTSLAVTDTVTGASVAIGTVTIMGRFTGTGGVTFNGTITLSGATLTLRLSGTPTQGSTRADVVPALISWTNSTTVTDVAGNAGVATAVAGTGSF